MQFFRTLKKLSAALFSFPLLPLLAVIKHGAHAAGKNPLLPLAFLLSFCLGGAAGRRKNDFSPTSGIIQENKSVRNLNFHRVRVREEVVAN